jgi:hypothetical protein
MSRHTAVLLEPLDTVDKTNMALMHHELNGIKILPTFKTSGQIMLGIDGRVRAVTHGTVKRRFTVFVAGGNRKHGFNDAIYRDIIA